MPNPKTLKPFKPVKTFRHAKLVIMGVIALVTLALTLLDQTHLNTDAPSTEPVTASVAAKVPEANFTLLDGGNVSLHSLAGHTVWLHFWASWCVPCREEFPNLLTQLQKEDSNVVLLAVSGDSNSLEANRFLEPMRRKFKPLFDSGRVILAQDPTHAIIEGVFQTFQYPETIIIAPNLVMTRKIIGIYKN